MESPITHRNSIDNCSVSEVLNALRSKDEAFLEKVRDTLSLVDLDADYEGVIVEEDQYDPDEIGRDFAVEILRDILEVVDDERGITLEQGGDFVETELRHIEDHITEEMRQNVDGVHATLWFAELSDDTKSITVAIAQYSEGEREFLEFSETREDTLARFLSTGRKVV